MYHQAMRLADLPYTAEGFAPDVLEEKMSGRSGNIRLLMGLSVFAEKSARSAPEIGGAARPAIDDGIEH